MIGGLISLDVCMHPGVRQRRVESISSSLEQFLAARSQIAHRDVLIVDSAVLFKAKAI